MDTNCAYNRSIGALRHELERLEAEGITEVGFVSEGVDPTVVTDFVSMIEHEFGVSVPEEYRSFLVAYGRVGVQSSSIFGIDIRPPDRGDPDQCGLLYRNRQLASHPYLARFFVLGEDDFCLYAVDKKSGEFVQVGKGDQVVEATFQSCDEMLVKVLEWMTSGLEPIGK